MHYFFKITTPCGLTEETAMQALVLLQWHRKALEASYCSEEAHASTNGFTRDVVSLSDNKFLRRDVISSFIKSRLEMVSGTTVVDTHFFETLEYEHYNTAAIAANDDRNIVFPIHVGENCMLGVIMPKKGEIWVIETLRSQGFDKTWVVHELNVLTKLHVWCKKIFPQYLDDWKLLTFVDLPNLHPQQTDGRNCGVFVAIYAHYFITKGP